MRIVLSGLLLLATATPAAAVQDLLDVYELARRQDPELASSRAAVGAAEARYRQARGQLLPQLSGNASYSKVKQETDFGGASPFGGAAGGGGDGGDDFQDEHSLTLDLRQPLFDWSAWQAKDAADTRVAQAERELSAAVADLMVRSARRYFDVLAARASVTAAERRSDVIGRQLDRARAAFDSGLAPVTDVQQAQSQLDSVQVDAIGARNDLANSRDALTQLTGAPHPALAQAPPPYRVAPPVDGADAWVERALAHSPQLAARRQALLAARADISQARGGHYPTVDLTGRIGKSEQTVNFGTGNTTQISETESVGVQVSVPLFAGGATAAAVDEARQTSIQARQDMIRTQRQIELDTRTAYRDLTATAKRVRALGQAIESAETAVDAARAGLQNGTRNILDVLEAENDLIQRRAERKRAWYDYAVAGLRLKQAAGVLEREDLARVNARLVRERAAAMESNEQ